MPDRVKALEIKYKYSNDLCFGISVIIWPNWTMSWFEISVILFDVDELCFVVYLWIFTEGEGDGIESRLPFEIFSILTCQAVVGSWSGSHQIVLTQLSGSQLAWSACLYYVRCGNIWRICQYLKDFVNIWRICHTCSAYETEAVFLFLWSFSYQESSILKLTKLSYQLNNGSLFS